MKGNQFLIVAAGLCLLGGVAILYARQARGEEVPPKATVSPEYSEAFCLGWNTAQRLEASRFSNWRGQVMAGRTPDDRSGVPDLVGGVMAYVLIRPLAEHFMVDGGPVIDCTPPAKPEPAK